MAVKTLAGKSEGSIGGVVNGCKIYLVLTGWILPTDTSLNIQIDQNPSLGPLEFPSVWVPDSTSDSGWKKAIEYMGFPGGKTKSDANRWPAGLWDCPVLPVSSAGILAGPAAVATLPYWC